ncbi:5-formyltetrahydrofolate cyclo-ligase [Maridesulfovibrio bastinii]|uniref:5-formyltetrahydrofolate cyclo-ligase n=1 Tax=Maridesulfovibrio bastinii TaxID=47157 RepID=UPI00040BB268|nr:5-formyltetrahydrofolate cyclo-ligase [Maridesulfovibrio bastinii]
MNKEKLRKKLLCERAGLSSQQAFDKSESVVNSVKKLKAWAEAAEVLLYWPVRNEVDVRPLARSLWERGARVLLPCCRSDSPGEMDIGIVRAESDLVDGAYSIKEPDRSSCEFPQYVSPDIIIVPGVGFDRHGFRIGFGGGYYDRFLSRPEIATCLIVGVCYDFQIIESVPVENWDKPVHALCTEGETIWPR